MTTAPTTEWHLRDGKARVFLAPGRRGIQRPVILVGDAGTDLDTLTTSLEDGSYALLAELHASGRDLVLVGLTADGALGGQGETVQEVIMRTIGERVGSVPLAVGGTGRGALVTRYALARSENQAVDLQTSVHFSHNGTAPAGEAEVDLLDRMGNWPMRPLKLGLIGGGATSEIDVEAFDDSKSDSTDPGSALLSKELGTWLLERLPS
ncbi:hypothetical protein [Streptomyces sp. NBC_00094]|uniref:hypothetical protein n=1 Tax=Streptomyces sp. NBC_00094 TaxID=2903620 RepID=UPI00225BD4EB|nr:hypothetical protein [Streptomyces sp. NBC_00094]MCX5391127.1 hypothetical protein [Streptomyces sp. NBC_00094]